MAFPLRRTIYIGNGLVRSSRVYIRSVGIEAGLACALIPVTEVLTLVVGSVGSVGVDRLASISTGELAEAHLLIHPVGRTISHTRLVSPG